MKRRTFLKKTTGAGGMVLSSLAVGTGFSASELLSATRSSTASDKGKSPIRVGVITQEKGPHLGIYLDALATSEGLAGVAISDETGATFEQAESSLGERFPDLGKFRDYRQMIEEFKPQMVLISLEAHLAPDRIRKALEGNCSVLAEKPACVRAEDFEPLVQLAESRNLHLVLSLPGRLHPSAIKAKELIRSGFLGKLYGNQVFQVKDQTRLTRPSYQDSWFAFKDKAGGGHLIWLGIHNLDLIQYLADDPIAKVSAVCRNVGGQPVEIEDAEALALQFKNGMVGTFHGGYYLEQGGYQSAVTIWGSKGWLRISGSRHQIRFAVAVGLAIDPPRCTGRAPIDSPSNRRQQLPTPGAGCDQGLGWDAKGPSYRSGLPTGAPGDLRCLSFLRDGAGAEHRLIA